MRNTAKALGFLAALLPTLAIAQTPNYPQTLPPNTVVGRSGVGPGPSQAIPFATLKSYLGLGGTPGGTVGQIQYQIDAATFGGFTASGDCTINTSTGVVICLKTNGTLFATIATSGSASDLVTGTLPAGRLPALTGAVSSSAGSNSTAFANANANTVLSNWGASVGTPTFNTWPACANDGTHALVYINGTGLQCATITTSGTGTVTSVSVTGGTGITQSGSPVTGSGSITVNVDKSTNSNIWSATSNKVLTADAVFGSAANTVTSPSGCGTATVTLDLTAGINFGCTLTSATNFTLTNNTITSAQVGRQGCILFQQPVSGTVVSITYGAAWYAAGGSSTQTLTPTLNALDTVCYWVYSTSIIVFSINNSLSH